MLMEDMESPSISAWTSQTIIERESLARETSMD